MAQQIDGKIEEGSDAILEGANDLRYGIIDGMENQLAPELSSGLTKGLSQKLSAGIVKEANQMIDGAPQHVSHKIAEEITHLLQVKESEKKEELMVLLVEAEVPEDILNQVNTKLDELTPDYEQTGQLIEEKLAVVLEESLQGVQLTAEQQQQMEHVIKTQIEEGIESGVNSAINETVTNVNAGFDQYEQAIATGLDDATAGLDSQIKQALGSPIGQLQGGLEEINEGQSLLSLGVNELATGAEQLEDGAGKLVSGQADYVHNMYQFTDSFSDAQTGTNELARGTIELNQGLLQLKEGSTQLSEGAGQLSDGSDELYSGMNTLVDGTEEFNEKTHEASDEASDVTTTDETYNMIANPVMIENEKINDVPNYGTGFTPYFLSLGLFVGALMLSIVYPIREPLDKPASGIEWFITKFAGLSIIGVLQALIASGILLIGLKVEVQSVLLFILFAIITSLVFITLIQFLVTCFDNPGRFMAVIILILQLTTSAGTFPLELIPKLSYCSQLMRCCQ